MPREIPVRAPVRPSRGGMLSQQAKALEMQRQESEQNRQIKQYRFGEEQRMEPHRQTMAGLTEQKAQQDIQTGKYAQEGMQARTDLAKQTYDYNNMVEEAKSDTAILGFLLDMEDNPELQQQAFNRAWPKLSDGLQKEFTIDPQTGGRQFNKQKAMLAFSMGKAFSGMKDVPDEVKQIYESGGDVNALYKSGKTKRLGPAPEDKGKGSGAGGRGKSGLKMSDEAGMYKQIAQYYGGFYDPTTGEFNGLKGHEKDVQAIATRASRIATDNPDMTFTEATSEAIKQHEQAASNPDNLNLDLLYK